MLGDLPSASPSALEPGRGPDERKMQINAHPWCWGSVGLRVRVLHRARTSPSYPLKLSVMYGFGKSSSQVSLPLIQCFLCFSLWYWLMVQCVVSYCVVSPMQTYVMYYVLFVGVVNSLGCRWGVALWIARCPGHFVSSTVLKGWYTGLIKFLSCFIVVKRLFHW